MSNQSLTNYKGKTQTISCIGCDREQGKISSNDTFLKTKYFDAHQDYGTPIPGFVIVTSRRHIASIDEFTPEEKIDFIDTLTNIRKALRQIFKINTVYFYQGEDAPHFHIWIFPRYNWMTEKFGKYIESVRPIMNYAKDNLKTPDNLQEIDQVINKLKEFFSKKSSVKL